MKIEITVPNTLLKQCKHCSKPFIASRKDTKYCTRSCRQMAYIHRQAKILSNPVNADPIAVAHKEEGIIKRFINFLW